MKMYHVIKKILCFAVTLIGIVNCQKGYHTLALKLHDEHRAHHNSPPMNFNAELSAKAEQCVDHYIGLGKIDYSCPFKGNAGENLELLTNQNEDATIKQAIDFWYNEGVYYNFDKPWEPLDPGKTTKRFTQLIWADTTDLGFALKTDAVSNFDYVVALYVPPGNVLLTYSTDPKKQYTLFFKNLAPFGNGTGMSAGASGSGNTATSGSSSVTRRKITTACSIVIACILARAIVF